MSYLQLDEVTNSGLNDDTSDYQDTATFNMIQRMFSDAQRFRSLYDKDWQLYYRIYTGAHWPEGTTAGRSDWKARLTINYCFMVIEKILSIMTDQQPRLQYMAPNAQQQGYADLLQAVVDEIWDDENMPEYKLADWIKNSLIYGISWLKIYWDTEALDGLGAAKIDLCDPFDVYIDPMATSEDDAQYIIWTKYVSLGDALRMFPEHKAGILDSILQEDPKWMRRSSGMNTANASDYISTTIESPVMDDPTVPNSRPSNPTPWLGKSNKTRKVRILEAWVKDYTIIEKEITLYNGKTITVESYKYPHRLRVISFVGSCKVQDVPTPYETNKFPFVRLVNNTLPGEPYAFGDILNIWPLQKETNKRRSLLADHATYTGNPIWVVDEGALVNTNIITNMPGEIIKKRDGLSVRREPGLPIPQGLFALAEQAPREIREISGVAEVLSGRPPKGIRSGAAIEGLQEGALGVMRNKVRILKGALRRTGLLLAVMVKQFYTSARVVRVSSEPGKIEFKEFHGGWLENGWNVNIVTVSSASASRMDRFMKYLQMYQSGLVDQQAVLENSDIPDKDQILKRMRENQMKAAAPAGPGNELLDRLMSGAGRAPRSPTAPRNNPMGF